MFGRAGGERRGLAAGGARGPARGQRSFPRSRPPPPSRLLSNFPNRAGSSSPCQRPPAASRGAPLLFSSFFFSFFFFLYFFLFVFNFFFKDLPKLSHAPPVSLCTRSSPWAAAVVGQSSAPPVSGWCPSPGWCRCAPAVPSCGLGGRQRGMPGDRCCTHPVLAAQGARGTVKAQHSAGLALRWDLREVCVSLVNHHGCS